MVQISPVYDPILGAERNSDSGSGPTPGASSYPPSRAVMIDPNQTPVTGRVFATWAAADAYVTGTMSPSAADPVAILSAAGVITDAMVLRNYMPIIGQNGTYLTGAITSAISNLGLSS